MNDQSGPMHRSTLLEYFLEGATPRDRWVVGMELEKMGRDAGTGRPIPYDGAGASVRKVLNLLLEERGGSPVFEANNLIGLDGPWGGISLEPGGQVEWSSRPRSDLQALEADLDEHLRLMKLAGERIGVTWLDVAVDPELAVDDMTWMPKARYKIMRPFMGERGRLAHRMMTQTASIQCAFDYADPDDWKRKFRAAALMTPVAVALFANSSRVDGRQSEYRSYRQHIWTDTEPARCGLPPVVFDSGFDIEAWLDWIISVPAIFRHRARGLVPAGGTPFGELMSLSGCDAIRTEDWETHASSIFTDVRSYTYIEVRSADLQPDDLAMAVPTLWTGLLYDDDACGTALDLGRAWDDMAGWNAAVSAASREGLEATPGGRSLREIALELINASAGGLRRGAPCTGSPDAALRSLEKLGSHHHLSIGS